MDNLEAPFATAKGSCAILVVDDDVQVLNSLAGMMNSLGYRHVFRASSAEEALKIWSLHQSEIWLVVSDFIMPEQTGDRTVGAMLKEKPNLNFLFVSGNDPFTLDSEIPLCPGKNFLQKPFNVAEMRAFINTLCLAA